MRSNRPHDVREAVRGNYAAVAQQRGSGGCCGSGASCCGPAQADVASIGVGYSSEDVTAVPEGANMGLGCGNPQAIAALQPGEVVLDLGSGGGFDCFLAAGRVGPAGRVIGVDMTPEMLATARRNAEQGSYTNVEFRLGEIEALPVADGVVDIIMSNCVINLSPEKPRVYAEAFRVLKPGGRLAISDVVATQPIPADMRADLALLSGCISGAATVADIEAMLGYAGFADVRITVNAASRDFIKDWAPGKGVEEYVVSAIITAVKSGG
jgi:SAM-dependent methyltransferase